MRDVEFEKTLADMVWLIKDDHYTLQARVSELEQVLAKRDRAIRFLRNFVVAVVAVICLTLSWAAWYG